jgi:hypothetical protein
MTLTHSKSYLEMVRYPTLREMDSRCAAHNKLVDSDNELILNRIQFALNESGEEAEQGESELAAVNDHVREHRFQEARDKIKCLVQSESVDDVQRSMERALKSAFTSTPAVQPNLSGQPVGCELPATKYNCG